eukprot:6198551-Pleurochrysis_carterae.AAC.2
MLLPEITPRGSAGTLDITRKAPTTLHDFSSTQEKLICDWTPHDVAEWLYSQARCSNGMQGLWWGLEGDGHITSWLVSCG